MGSVRKNTDTLSATLEELDDAVQQPTALKGSWMSPPVTPRESEPKAAAQTFRNYEDSKFQDRVERTYYNIQTKQTVEYVQSCYAEYRKLDKAVLSMQDVSEILDRIIDESDPDNDLPQSIHAYQTAESVLTRYFEDRDPMRLKQDIPLEQFFGLDEWEALPSEAREMYAGKTLATHFPHIQDWSWFPLAGLIHDLGKVCSTEAFGERPQWACVGDTWATGCAPDPANIFFAKNFFEDNPDSTNPEYMTKHGIYAPHCGLDELLVSFGHDEYLAIVLNAHNADLAEQAAAGKPTPPKRIPDEAIYMIRFHSFYPWHSPRGEGRGYTHFANEKDWRCLPLVKALQKADLYSKSPNMPPIEELQAFYGKLMDDHFSAQVRW
jgi:inositol oxygenase